MLPEVWIESGLRIFRAGGNAPELLCRTFLEHGTNRGKFSKISRHMLG